MEAKEQEAILALSEFEDAMKHFEKQEFDACEQKLKEALQIVKRAEQEKSMGYVYLLKRLAHVCYTNRKFADAEKYFKVVLKVMPNVSTNPVNLYSAHKNLLLLYTFTDLDKAIEYGKGLKAAEKEFLPIHVKDLTFMVANIHFLRGDYSMAKLSYRSTLQSSPSDEVKYQVLNNLGFTSFAHVLDIPKIKDQISDAREFEQVYQAILHEESFTGSFYTEALAINEKTNKTDADADTLTDLFEMNLNEKEGEPTRVLSED